jgi:hypothetical protein
MEVTYARARPIAVTTAASEISLAMLGGRCWPQYPAAWVPGARWARGRVISAMACSVLADGGEAHKAVADEHRSLLRRPVVHLYLEDVESGLDEAVGGLPVEVDFGMAAARGQLESVVCAAIAQSEGDDFGVGLEDDGEVGAIGLGVELP